MAHINLQGNNFALIDLVILPTFLQVGIRKTPSVLLFGSLEGKGAYGMDTL
jgi:hypothetical protein